MVVKANFTEARKLGLPVPKRKKQVKPSHALFLRLCQEHGLPEPIPEYTFHPERKWRADWAFTLRRDWQPNLRREVVHVLVEIEGGAFSQGRHNRGAGFRRDLEKYNEAAILGYYVIRCLPEDVESGKLFGWLRRIAGLE